jgi:hypothetical protein
MVIEHRKSLDLFTDLCLVWIHGRFILLKLSKSGTGK